jgi:hypothetical protein
VGAGRHHVPGRRGHLAVRGWPRRDPPQQPASPRERRCARPADQGPAGEGPGAPPSRRGRRPAPPRDRRGRDRPRFPRRLARQAAGGRAGGGRAWALLRHAPIPACHRRPDRRRDLGAGAGRGGAGG